MARIKPPFAATKKGFSFNLGPEERHVVRRLIGEVGELLKTSVADDPKMARLFPPAYSADEEAETEYQRLMRDELVASRLHSIAQAEELLADDSVGLLTFAQLDAFSASLNSVRLVLGTLLGVGEADEDLDDEDPRTDELALYNFLSWLLENAIQALMESSV